MGVSKVPHSGLRVITYTQMPNISFLNAQEIMEFAILYAIQFKKMDP
jgi:hypothetical protein